MDFLSFIEESATMSRLTYPMNTFIQLADDLGQTEAQLRSKLDDLFAAYPGEWALYLMLGAKTALEDALLADTSLPWLDVEVRGISVRARIVHAVGVWQARRGGTFTPIEPKPTPLPPE